MTVHQRTDTAARAQGFDARLEAVFDWVVEHWAYVAVGVAAVVAFGAISAGVYEYRKRVEARAQFALSEVEDRYVQAMGVDRDGLLVAEPANPETAQRVRLEARDGFDAVVGQYGSSRAARVARLRAAQMEAELGVWDDAAWRLLDLSEDLGGDDPLRAITLRLRGWVLEQSGSYAEAGAAYEAAARVETYPPRGAAWILAGQSYARAGRNQEAVNALQEALSLDPELAERAGILGQIQSLSTGF